MVENCYYERARAEVDRGEYIRSLWHQAYARADNNEEEAYYIYIRWRADQLSDSVRRKPERRHWDNQTPAYDNTHAPMALQESKNTQNNSVQIEGTAQRNKQEQKSSGGTVWSDPIQRNNLLAKYFKYFFFANLIVSLFLGTDSLDYESRTSGDKLTFVLIDTTTIFFGVSKSYGLSSLIISAIVALVCFLVSRGDRRVSVFLRNSTFALLGLWVFGVLSRLS